MCGCVRAGVGQASGKETRRTPLCVEGGLAMAIATVVRLMSLRGVADGRDAQGRVALREFVFGAVTCEATALRRRECCAAQRDLSPDVEAACMASAGVHGSVAHGGARIAWPRARTCTMVIACPQCRQMNADESEPSAFLSATACAGSACNSSRASARLALVAGRLAREGLNKSTDHAANSLS